MMIQATENDAKKLYKIIEERSRWLQQKGVKQWNPPYPKKLFFKDVANGYVFYFVDDKKIIGTATLYNSKPYYYPQDLWNDAVKSWYLCRFAVPCYFKNKQVGQRLIREIFDKAIKVGIQRIRIDIVKANPFLEKYYLKYGFKCIREDLLFDTPSIFMEKIIEK